MKLFVQSLAEMMGSDFLVGERLVVEFLDLFLTDERCPGQEY